MNENPRRHKWAAKVEFPLAHKSERECQNGCGIVKTTRHENRSHWVEYWRGLEKISVDKTPACEPVIVQAEPQDQPATRGPHAI